MDDLGQMAFGGRSGGIVVAHLGIITLCNVPCAMAAMAPQCTNHLYDVLSGPL